MIRSNQARFFAAIASSVLLAASAHAAITASSGSSLNAGDASCFTKSRTGIVTNICSTARTWCVSDYITSSGNKTVQANGFIPNGGSSFSCTSTSVSQTGGLFQSRSATLTVINQNTNLSSMVVNVPSFGALNICCDLTANTRLNTINY